MDEWSAKTLQSQNSIIYIKNNPTKSKSFVSLEHIINKETNREQGIIKEKSLFQKNKTIETGKFRLSSKSKNKDPVQVDEVEQGLKKKKTITIKDTHQRTINNKEITSNINYDCFSTTQIKLKKKVLNQSPYKSSGNSNNTNTIDANINKLVHNRNKSHGALLNNNMTQSKNKNLNFRYVTTQGSLSSSQSNSNFLNHIKNSFSLKNSNLRQPTFSVLSNKLNKTTNDLSNHHKNNLSNNELSINLSKIHMLKTDNLVVVKSNNRNKKLSRKKISFSNEKIDLIKKAKISNTINSQKTSKIYSQYNNKLNIKNLQEYLPFKVHSCMYYLSRYYEDKIKNEITSLENKTLPYVTKYESDNKKEKNHRYNNSYGHYSEKERDYKINSSKDIIKNNSSYNVNYDNNDLDEASKYNHVNSLTNVNNKNPLNNFSVYNPIKTLNILYNNSNYKKSQLYPETIDKELTNTDVNDNNNKMQVIADASTNYINKEESIVDYNINKNENNKVVLEKSNILASLKYITVGNNSNNKTINFKSLSSPKYQKSSKFSSPFLNYQQQVDKQKKIIIKNKVLSKKKHLDFSVGHVNKNSIIEPNTLGTLNTLSQNFSSLIAERKKIVNSKLDFSFYSLKKKTNHNLKFKDILITKLQDNLKNSNEHDNDYNEKPTIPIINASKYFNKNLKSGNLNTINSAYYNNNSISVNNSNLNTNNSYTNTKNYKNFNNYKKTLNSSISAVNAINTYKSNHLNVKSSKNYNHIKSNSSLIGESNNSKPITLFIKSNLKTINDKETKDEGNVNDDKDDTISNFTHDVIRNKIREIKKSANNNSSIIFITNNFNKYHITKDDSIAENRANQVAINNNNNNSNYFNPYNSIFNSTINNNSNFSTIKSYHDESFKDQIHSKSLKHLDTSLMNFNNKKNASTIISNNYDLIINNNDFKRKLDNLSQSHCSINIYNKKINEYANQIKTNHSKVGSNNNTISNSLSSTSTIGFFNNSSTNKKIKITNASGISNTYNSSNKETNHTNNSNTMNVKYSSLVLKKHKNRAVNKDDIFNKNQSFSIMRKLDFK